MSLVFSSIINSFAKQGLGHLLLKSDERRNSLSQALDDEQNGRNIKGKTFDGRNLNNRSSVSSNNAHNTSSFLQKQREAKQHASPVTQVNAHIAGNPPQVNGNSYSNDGYYNQNDNISASKKLAPVSQNPTNTAHSQGSSQQQTQAKQGKFPTLNYAEWPDKWYKWHKSFGLPASEGKSSLIRIAWTYEGLEQDVLGSAHDGRKKVVRQLLMDLNHQKGTHVFIPYAELTEEGQSRFAVQGENSFFWSAMRFVRPRILLVFGSVARNAVEAPKSLPLQMSQMGSLQVLQMHKLETLMEDHATYTNTLVFLQTYLHFCKKNRG